MKLHIRTETPAEHRRAMKALAPILEEWGIPWEDSEPPLPVLTREVALVMRETMTAIDIAKMFGVTTQKVYALTKPK